jgi:quercetin dioxygenase-like cupin family protein
MKHVHYTEVEREDVDDPAASGVKVRWLIGREDGAENFAMRRFDVSPGGHTPHHSHDFEHEVLVLEGRGILKVEDRDEDLEKGDVAFLPANIVHQFVNDRDETLSFLCVIPNKD